MINPDQVVCVVPAAGSGVRMGTGDKKQFRPVEGRPMLATTISRLAASGQIGSFVVAVSPCDEKRVSRLLLDFSGIRLTAGGATRQQSVFNALKVLPSDCRWVLVHDAARPWVRPSLISRVLSRAAEVGAAVPGLPANETLKMVNDRDMIVRTLSRQGVYLIQTPQAFERYLLENAHDLARAQGFAATDDAALVERLGHDVAVVEGHLTNVKVTHARDLCDQSGWLRTGMGYDAHRFDPDRPLYLGGIHIADSPGLAGHSDADVLLHAVMDAILGATGQGDIGEHFPPGDAQFKDISSRILLERVMALVTSRGWQVRSIDITVVAEKPRLTSHRQDIRLELANMLGLHESRVNVKATTTEGMGFTGRGEGIEAYCVANVYGEECP